MHTGPVWLYFLGWLWDGHDWQTETARPVSTSWEQALLEIDPFQRKYGKAPGEVWRSEDGRYRSGRIYSYDPSPSGGAWAEWHDPGAGGFLGEARHAAAAGWL